MSTNAPSVRYPFTFPPEVHESVVQAARYSFNGLVDLNQAIAALVPKVTGNATSITNINTLIASIQTSITNLQNQIQQSSASNLNLGVIDFQPLDSLTTSWTTLASDYGALILVQSTANFPVDLDSGLQVPFFTTVFNVGPGLVPLTPTSGTLNNASSLTLATNQGAILYFDSENWWAFIYPTPIQSIAKVAHEWLDSYNAATGLFTQSQPGYSDLSGLPLYHDEPLTDGHSNFIFANGDVVVVVNIHN
jgi:hypothetical protein